MHTLNIMNLGIYKLMIIIINQVIKHFKEILNCLL